MSNWNEYDIVYMYMHMVINFGSIMTPKSYTSNVGFVSIF